MSVSSYQVKVKPQNWLVSGVKVFVIRVTHLTEARHEEIVAPVIWRCVLLDVCKLYKLRNTQNEPLNPSKHTEKQLHMTNLEAEVKLLNFEY